MFVAVIVFLLILCLVYSHFAHGFRFGSLFHDKPISVLSRFAKVLVLTFYVLVSFRCVCFRSVKTDAETSLIYKIHKSVTMSRHILFFLFRKYIEINNVTIRNMKESFPLIKYPCY